MTNVPGQSQKVCAFCGERKKLTKEHIFADWIQSVIPKGGESNHMVNLSWPGLERFRPGPQNRPGDILSRRLKIVCRDCNGGWMSRLQNRVRPILSPMILGTWQPLGYEDQLTLSRWAAMTAAVIEFADPNTMAVPAADRKFMFDESDIPQHWRVWVGHYVGCETVGYWHNGMITFDLEARRRPDKGVQVTTFSIGKVLFQVYSNNFNWVEPPPEIMEFGLREIGRNSPGKMDLPAKTLDDEAAFQFLHLLERKVLDELVVGVVPLEIV